MHDKVKAFAIAGFLALAVLVLIDRGTALDLVPNDIEKLFWAAVAPLLIGLGAAYQTRESKGPTKRSQ